MTSRADPLMRIANFLSQNLDRPYLQMMRYLCRGLGKVPTLVAAPRFADFIDGEIDLAFMCGYPFTAMNAVIPGAGTAIAAPLLDDSRVIERPVYFGDVIVNTDSSLTEFAHLQQKRFAYNEVVSLSGYKMLEDYLLPSSGIDGFCSDMIESGSHQRSIEMVIAGDADYALIDSQALAVEAGNDPGINTRLRRIGQFGPHPMPPVVASRRMSLTDIDDIGTALSRIHLEQAVSHCLRRAQVRRFVPVSSDFYVPIEDLIRNIRNASGDNFQGFVFRSAA